MAIDLNLEIIVDVNHTLLAFRHDQPDDMMPLVIITDHRQIFDEENISSEVLAESRTLMVGVRHEICLS